MNKNILTVAAKRLTRAARCYSNAPNLPLAPHRLNMKLESFFHAIWGYEGNNLYLQPTIIAELQRFFGTTTVSQIPWLPNPVDDAKEFYTVSPIDIPACLQIEPDIVELLKKRQAAEGTKKMTVILEGLKRREDDASNLVDFLGPSVVEQLFAKGGKRRHLFTCLSKPIPSGGVVSLNDIPNSLGHPIAELLVAPRFTVTELHRTLSELQAKLPKDRRVLMVSRMGKPFYLQSLNSSTSPLSMIPSRFPHRFWPLCPAAPTASAFLTVLDPPADLGLDLQSISRHSAAATIYSIVFLQPPHREDDDNTDATVGPVMYQLHLQLVTQVVLPVLNTFYTQVTASLGGRGGGGGQGRNGDADSAQQQQQQQQTEGREPPSARLSIFALSGFPNAAMTLNDLRRCIGWEFFEHIDWLGSLPTLLSRLSTDGTGSGSMPYLITPNGWIFPIQSTFVFESYWKPLLETAAKKVKIAKWAPTSSSQKGIKNPKVSKAIETEEEFQMFLRYGELLTPQTIKIAALDSNDKQGHHHQKGRDVFCPEFIDAFRSELHSLILPERQCRSGTNDYEQLALTSLETRLLLVTLLNAGHCIPGVERL